MSIRFAINGYRGRMGQAVARVLGERDLPIVARFEKGDSFDLSQSDAVIDFSTPEASLELLEACAGEGLARPKPLVHVIGSTGFTQDQIDRIAPFADQVVIVRSGNYSLGVNLLAGLVKQAAARLDAADWDIGPACRWRRSGRRVRRCAGRRRSACPAPRSGAAASISRSPTGRRAP